MAKVAFDIAIPDSQILAQFSAGMRLPLNNPFKSPIPSTTV
jgi:hypothetical protein